MIELVTDQGWRFEACAVVRVGDALYDMDALNEKQRQFVGGKLEEQALNAAFAGKATFTATGLPAWEEVFV